MLLMLCVHHGTRHCSTASFLQFNHKNRTTICSSLTFERMFLLSAGHACYDTRIVCHYVRIRYSQQRKTHQFGSSFDKPMVVRVWTFLWRPCWNCLGATTSLPAGFGKLKTGWKDDTQKAKLQCNSQNRLLNWASIGWCCIHRLLHTLTLSISTTDCSATQLGRRTRQTSQQGRLLQQQSFNFGRKFSQGGGCHVKNTRDVLRLDFCRLNFALWPIFSKKLTYFWSTPNRNWYHE